MAENLYQALAQIGGNFDRESELFHEVLKVLAVDKKTFDKGQSTTEIESVYNAIPLIVNYASPRIVGGHLRGIDMLNRATLSMLFDFEAGRSSLTISPRQTHRTNVLVWLSIAAVLRGHSVTILTQYEENLNDRIDSYVQQLPVILRKRYHANNSNIVSKQKKRILFSADFEFISSDLIDKHIVNGNYDQYIFESTINRKDDSNYKALVNILEEEKFTIKTFSPSAVGMTDGEIENIKKMLNNDDDLIRTELYCERHEHIWEQIKKEEN